MGVTSLTDAIDTALTALTAQGSDRPAQGRMRTLSASRRSMAR